MSDQVTTTNGCCSGNGCNDNGNGSNGNGSNGNGWSNGNGEQLSGAVLVCGGGVAGIQASLDLSAAGYRVYLVEQSPTIGGGMARLDKTFPTGDCATCIISPKLVECMRDHNIDVLTMADVAHLEGEAGRFKATVVQRPRGVNADKCTGCGDCWQNCPTRNVPQDTRPFAPTAVLSTEDSVWLEGVLAQYASEPGPLLPILQDINDHRGYLPRLMLERVAVRLDIPLPEILRVASFYNAFSLEPVGRHKIEVCLGTACFVRGSGLLLERLEQEIGIPAGSTDKDMRFTLDTVRCIGCCALAPAMRIDGVTFGKVKLDKVPGILERFQ
jgi:NADH:ubiquinone oxidoreductase subunit E/NAD-dependent dihydropyrimidine dehydrogenase PreA subunit